MEKLLSSEHAIPLMLLAALAALVTVIRILYKEKKACEVHRLEITKDVGDLKGDLKEVSAKLEGEESKRNESLRHVEEIHRSVIRIVSGAVRDGEGPR